MQQFEPFEGVIARTEAESEPWWPVPPHPGPDAPNVVVILLDDTGFSHLGCYGSDLATPTIDGLAERGLRLTNFHTTALCSPTRACLLTGRNHHRNGLGRVADLAVGFPGYNGEIPRENGFLSEILRQAGYDETAIAQLRASGTVGSMTRTSIGATIQIPTFSSASIRTRRGGTSGGTQMSSR